MLIRYLLFLLVVINCFFSCNGCNKFEISPIEKEKIELVYGLDDRKEVSQTPAIHKELLDNIVLIASKRNFQIDNNGNYYIDYNTLDSRLKTVHKLCPNERFSNQNVVGFGTGICVGSDLILTASHVIPQDKFSQYVYIFEFYDNFETNRIVFPKENAYTTKNVLFSRKDSPTEDFDLALIQLDRLVPSKRISKVNFDFDFKISQSVFVLGHPNGIAMKYADNAEIKYFNKNIFKANLDVFGGNSGSPIFNVNNEVIGILSTAPGDYNLRFDNNKCCKKVALLPDNCSDNWFFPNSQRLNKIKDAFPNEYNMILNSGVFQ